MPDGEELAVMDFTTAILQQTFEGLVQAMLAQKERNAELLQVSTRTPEEYATEHVSEEMVRDKLIEIFGGAEGEEEGEGCRVDAGQSYIRAEENTEESPKILKLLGIAFEEGDYLPLKKKKKGATETFLISERGAQRLEEAARQKIAKESLEKLQRLVAGGLPEIYVESGRILSKASFRVEENSYGTEKVLLRTLSTSNPGIFRMKTEMSGEIEVHFKVGRS